MLEHENEGQGHGIQHLLWSHSLVCLRDIPKSRKMLKL